MDDLARRAVACKGWRWMPGMRGIPSDSYFGREAMVFLGAGAWSCLGGGIGANKPAPPCGMLPDLTDPATLGCLLALAREAWGSPNASAWGNSHSLGDYWEVAASPGTYGCGATEAEALVTALEAAP